MNKKNLNEISSVISTELDIFSEKYKQSLRSNVGLVDLVTKYIMKQKGKKIRPLLVLLSAKLCGSIDERTYRGATLVEILHTATLIHDDVVDNADKRRGLPSINAVWKNKISVLMGDYLLSKGLMLAVDGDDFDFLRVITNAVKRMSEGELLQISKTRKLNIDYDAYYRIISDKTASLLSTCCEIGARSATQSEEEIKALREYGENFGIAFQIRDDILDYTGNFNVFGKTPGTDIKEKKITLPLLYALNEANDKIKKEILSKVKSSSRKNNLSDVINFVVDNGGIEYADKIAKEFAAEAKSRLSIFPGGETRGALEKLLDFVVDRKK